MEIPTYRNKQEEIGLNQEQLHCVELRTSMLSEQLQREIERMREEEYSPEDDEGKQFANDVAKGVALFFNKIVYSINKLKSNGEQRVPASSGCHRQNEKQSNKKTQGNLLKLENHQTWTPDFDKKTNEVQGKSQISHDKIEMREIQLLYKTKQDKLQNKPKKPVSSFFLYYQQKSKELSSQYGEMAGARVAQLVADTWNNLPQQQKQPYNDRVNSEKERYKEQMSKFIEDHSSEINQIKRLKRMKHNKMRQLNRKIKDNDDILQDIKEEEPDSETVTMKIKGISQRQMKAAERKNYSHRPKAPVSSFFLYYQEEAKNIAVQYNESVGSRIARLASNIWKTMTKEEKQKYEEAAKIERERYHQQMIQYKVDYPDEVERRRKKISNNMKRTLKMENELVKDELSSQESLVNLSVEESSSESHPSANSYESSDSPSEKKEMEFDLGKVPSKRERKEKEDPMPHKPKGPICSFFQYYHANLKQFMKKEPGDTQRDAGSEFVRRASLKWKTLTDEEKQQYHELAKVDRQRYQTDMDHFKQVYPVQYQHLKAFNKTKQMKNKKKKQARLDLKDLELDEFAIE